METSQHLSQDDLVTCPSRLYEARTINLPLEVNVTQSIYRKEHMSIFHKKVVMTADCYTCFGRKTDIYFVKNDRHDEIDIYFNLKEAIDKADTQADID